MDYDPDKVDEMVLALLYLTIVEEDDEGARTWKSHDWLTPEGVQRARNCSSSIFPGNPAPFPLLK